MSEVLNKKIKLKCWQKEKKPKQRAWNIPLNFKSQMWHRVISHFLYCSLLLDVLQGSDCKKLSCLLSLFIYVVRLSSCRTQKLDVKWKTPGDVEDVYHFSKTSIYLYLPPSTPSVRTFPRSIDGWKTPGDVWGRLQRRPRPFPSLLCSLNRTSCASEKTAPRSDISLNVHQLPVQKC